MQSLGDEGLKQKVRLEVRIGCVITHALSCISTSSATEEPSSRDEVNGRQDLKPSAIHPMHEACSPGAASTPLQAIVWKC